MKLIVPSIEELNYRKFILADPDTMSYNAGLDLNVKGYDNSSGCIEFPEDYWSDWFLRWINKTPDKYYAYLYHEDMKKYVGEVALRYETQYKSHMISIIVEGQYRGLGYGEIGLRLLLETGFNKLLLEEVVDVFPVSRIESMRLFEKFGFHKSIDEDMVIFRLKRDKYLEMGRT